MTMSAFGVEDTRISKGFAGARIIEGTVKGSTLGQRAGVSGRNFVRATAPARAFGVRHGQAARAAFGEDAAKVKSYTDTKLAPVRNFVRERPLTAVGVAAGGAAAGTGLGAAIGGRKRNQTY